MIDKDKTGSIDWWEFLNHESVKVLSRRDKVSKIEIFIIKGVRDFCSEMPLGMIGVCIFGLSFTVNVHSR